MKRRDETPREHASPATRLPRLRELTRQLAETPATPDRWTLALEVVRLLQSILRRP